ncbi:MAG: hypothetical protein ACRCUS_04775, partial [Anaerovoracaceae bacterium]
MDNKKRFLDAVNMKQCNSLSHGDVMIHDKLVAELTNVHLVGDDGNALAKWMMDEMSEENFSRHQKARKFLGMDWCQVFPTEKTIKSDKTSEGHIYIEDIWGMVQLISTESSEIVRKPIIKASDIKNYKFPKKEEFAYNN